MCPWWEKPSLWALVHSVADLRRKNTGSNAVGVGQDGANSGRGRSIQEQLVSLGLWALQKGSWTHPQLSLAVRGSQLCYSGDLPRGARVILPRCHRHTCVHGSTGHKSCTMEAVCIHPTDGRTEKTCRVHTTEHRAAVEKWVDLETRTPSEVLESPES